MSNRMNITFTLPKGNWHETQHRNHQGGITKKYRTPHGLNFTFNLGEKPQPHRKGQGGRYHLRHNHKKQTQNFCGGKHPRNSKHWRQHNQRTQQQQTQPQPQGVPSQFYETVSPSDFQSWERHNRLSPMTMSQDYTWQPSAPTTSLQQQQSDTQHLLDQEIEKMCQNHQSQTQQLIDERQKNLQQYFDNMRRQYQLDTQQAQYDIQSSLGGSRSPSTLSACPGIDEDEASVIFDGYHYL